MPDVAGSEQRCGIGARLRAGRERGGMTLLQAAERLHIDPHMLEALETERFESLGAKVYLRGYLHNYADLVGENFTELYGLLEGSQRTAAPDLRRAPGTARQLARGNRAWTGVFVGAAAVVACAVWWVLSRSAG